MNCLEWPLNNLWRNPAGWDEDAIEGRGIPVAALVFECLDVQRVLIGKEAYFIEDQNGHINGKALGYVFGFLDAC